MAKWRWTNGLRTMLGQSAPLAVIGIRSTQQMQEILERERARASRGRTMFSLLAFSLSRKTGDIETLDRLAAWLQQRLRSLDDIGWLNVDTIGAVLPDTSAQAATTLMDEVSAAVPDEIGTLECRVYTFPEDSWDEHDRVRDDDRECDSDDFESGSKRALTTPYAIDQASSAHNVYSAEMLFAKPMPVSKRYIDVLGAVVGLIVLSPLLLAVAIAIKLSSPGPVFFSQWRAGLGGRRFRLHKFRSMVVDAEQRKAELMAQNEQDGPAFKIADDPRMTALGRGLRKTSIDELPQLWNVLKGEMSLVGPRPLPDVESDACEAWHRRRLHVTPGLTCIWQVFGRSRVSFEEWMRMDIRYLSSRSLIGDLKLVAETVPAVLTGRGAR